MTDTDAPSVHAPWRVGEHYAIHVYEGDRPVATFANALDAEMAVSAYNGRAAAPADEEPTIRAVSMIATRDPQGGVVLSAWDGSTRTRVHLSRLEAAQLRRELQAVVRAEPVRS